jgi:tetratricopeptide (TPR) repeat protein
LLGLNGVWLMAAERQDQARTALSERDPRAADEAYEAAAGLMPLDAELLVRWAGLKQGLGSGTEAEQLLRRAAALAPTWGRPHYRLGQLLESAGRLPEAANEIDRAARRDPRSSQPLAELAKVREAQGDHAAALAIYRRIVVMEGTLGGVDGMTDPNPAVAHEALGREAEARADPAAAIREYRAAAERLRQYRMESPYRTAIQKARGDSAPDREAELQQLELRLWQRLAELYTRARQPDAAVEARREAAAAQATSQPAPEPAPGS